ncbi:MAG: cupin domain-containing protein [Methylococcaceae bacterium]
MSALTIYDENSPKNGELFTEFTDIEAKLNAIGVQFERWTAAQVLTTHASNDEVLTVYGDSIDRLKHQYGFQSADVIKLDATHPDKVAIRQRFRAEHTHSEFEVRFFVEGRGLFYLHVGAQVFGVLCEQGDLISVPANVTHWFDTGEHPHLACIRLFTNPEGWVADFTDNDTAKLFPTLDELQRELAA